MTSTRTVVMVVGLSFRCGVWDGWLCFVYYTEISVAFLVQSGFYRHWVMYLSPIALNWIGGKRCSRRL